jgi:hypothetical protein
MPRRAAQTAMLSLLMLVASVGTPARGAEEGNTVAEIEQLLNGKAATHQRFWADDLLVRSPRTSRQPRRLVNPAAVIQVSRIRARDNW